MRARPGTGCRCSEHLPAVPTLRSGCAVLWGTTQSYGPAVPQPTAYSLQPTAHQPPLKGLRRMTLGLQPLCCFSFFISSFKNLCRYRPAVSCIGAFVRGNLSMPVINTIHAGAMRREVSLIIIYCLLAIFVLRIDTSLKYNIMI